MAYNRRRRARRGGRSDGSFWLSFSDLMSSLVLIIILIMFYIMYQYFDMYETSTAELAAQQANLDAANAELEQRRAQYDRTIIQMNAQQEVLDKKEAELDTANADLDAAKADLLTAQADLQTAQATLTIQQADLAAAQNTLAAQRTQIADQQTKLESQQAQIEQLVGMKPRIISSLSNALHSANIAASVDPASGAIALEADVLFDVGQHKLTDEGKATIDGFLPVYLNVLFSEEYRPYISEIIIEGHTDSLGSYIQNLELSQERAGSVASYVLSDEYRGITAAQRTMLREIVTANGRSFSDPVLDANGRENMDASRRVVFKFRLTDEQMIAQLQSILENN